MNFDHLLDLIFRKGALLLIVLILVCAFALSGCVVFDVAACFCNASGCEGMKNNWIDASQCSDEGCYSLLGSKTCGIECGVIDCLYNPNGCDESMCNGCVRISCGGSNYACIEQLCSGQFNLKCENLDGIDYCSCLNCRVECK